MINQQMNIKKILILASVALVGFSSCSKDEDQGSSANKIPGSGKLIIDGTAHVLDEGFITSSGQITGQATMLNFTTFESSVNVFYDAMGAPDSIAGSGYVFSTIMISPDSTQIGSGQYFIFPDFNGTLFTMVGLVSSFSNGSNEVVSELVDGAVVVTNSKGVTSFDGFFTGSDGKEIDFTYQKRLAVIDGN